MNKVILQHGSILCGKKHSELPNFLNDQTHIIELKEELADKTIEIETILNQKINYLLLSKKIKKQFENEWEFTFIDSTNLFISKFVSEN